MNISKKSIVLALGVTLASGIFAGEALAYQEHMHAAMDALRTAHHELEMADPNKGGHREAAMRLIDQAMAETQAGIDYAR